MSITTNQPLPTTGRLLKSTLLAAAIAGALLVTAVLPAEYGLDPIGIGRALGLTALADGGSTVIDPSTPTSSTASGAEAALAEKAAAAFGANKGQSLDPGAVSLTNGELRQDAMTITLEPGKGKEVKSHMVAGTGMLFRWKATGDVAVDMHGERPDVKGAWTSYAVEGAQREARGTFVAPFEGTHGWYWQNRGDKPVTVSIELIGYQADIYQP
ncbi:hypothetical protein D7U93_07335 [Stenotrophomonas maltophilia]|uniref:hypothetical protein n=1 Tax=Stenotrophomonas TaxID=40323 RepID=UPI00027A6E72|nr:MULTISPECIES: hypothetical protein [Stenotrophomonas]EJP78449.1 hypothetical protein A1OC_04515 [Stenotrophomonas maltophilia Ab55555]ELE7121804.1 hypothetical protein [Stenotrophomonas maltophilia]MBA0379333.1 hypothetical protein [Stenotrophomonas maltophilia]MBA0407876.1 hypothetical protein [Stenotrophomonas maltophilia]MBA0425381.1 hypothetical protein [Stenotrophomonas maltophilia]